MKQVKGLTLKQVEDSRNKHGSNKLSDQKVETFWDKLLENLKDPMIIILIIIRF